MEMMFRTLPGPKSKKKSDLFPCWAPDLDNYCKAFLDALEGLIFINDSRIVDIHLKKLWGDPPRVEIAIGEMIDGS